MTQRQQVVPLRGGLDLVSPAMMVDPGYVIAGLNYEVEARGYRRSTGFERLDGRPKPSDAAYYILMFDGGTAAINEDDLVTGATSGATGIAAAAAVVESGSYGGGDAAGYLVLYNISATAFQNDENLQVSAVTKSVADGTTVLNAATTDALNSTYIQAVTTKRRAAIAQPAGSGPIRGVATYNGDNYCWRDNAGATAGVMFKATTAGWVAQTFGSYILFDAGTAAFLEGETLTGGTSGATATIERVIRNAGSWGSTASGYLVLSGVTNGPFQNNEAITSASGAALANGADVAITLPPGGEYHTITHNFFSQETTTRLYGANGVGPAFSWDGTVFAPIFTQLSAALEKPKFVAEFSEHLFLAYAGGSVQNSATGEPLIFDALQGSLEFGFGQDPTGLLSDMRDSLIVTARNKVGYLVGKDANDFELRSISKDSGAIAGTLQVVGQPIFMDDQGLREMVAAQTFGDWKIGTITRIVEPLLATKKAAGVTIVGSLRVRSKDQYRLFYSDGTGIFVYFGRKTPEMMVFDLGVTPACFASGEAANGDEVLLMGSSDGWVYEIDKGTSFDGSAIEAYIRTSFLNQGFPNREKRYHRARIEGQAGLNNSALSVTADFGYGNPDQPPAVETLFTFFGGGGFWDEAFWDEFFWDSQVEGQAYADLNGIGENISIVIASNSATEAPGTLSTITVPYSLRRVLR